TQGDEKYAFVLREHTTIPAQTTELDHDVYAIRRRLHHLRLVEARPIPRALTTRLGPCKKLLGRIPHLDEIVGQPDVWIVNRCGERVGVVRVPRGQERIHSGKGSAA